MSPLSKSCCRSWRTTRLWRSSVVRMKSSFEISEARQHRLELRADPVGKLLRGNAPGLRRLLDLLAMLVRARQEIDRVAHQPAVPGDHVRQDLLIGVADVRRAVNVVDRRRDVKVTHGGAIQARFIPSPQASRRIRPRPGRGGLSGSSAPPPSRQGCSRPLSGTNRGS